MLPWIKTGFVGFVTLSALHILRPPSFALKFEQFFSSLLIRQQGLAMIAILRSYSALGKSRFAGWTGVLRHVAANIAQKANSTSCLDYTLSEAGNPFGNDDINTTQYKWKKSAVVTRGFRTKCPALRAQGELRIFLMFCLHAFTRVSSATSLKGSTFFSLFFAHFALVPMRFVCMQFTHYNTLIVNPEHS